MLLEQKYKTYLKLIQERQDGNGFIESDHCDSLLFTSLAACSPNVSIWIGAAKSPDGRWNRRPTQCLPCTSEGWDRSILSRIAECLKARSMDRDILRRIFERGNSTISRDMLLGLAWYAYHKKQLYISESVINYALSHKMIMGDGTPTKTLMTPGLLSTFAWVSYRLGGPSRYWLRWIPNTASSGLYGYQAHLAVLHIMLRHGLEHKISKKNQSVLDEQIKRSPRNPLFLIAAKRFIEVANVLNDASLWPEDRLPTSADRKTEWLQMRDEGDDWRPSDDGRLHSGGDFIFLYWLLKHQSQLKSV